MNVIKSKRAGLSTCVRGLLFLAVLLSVFGIHAQSTDPSNPTRLQSKLVQGTWDSEANYFYVFEAGPGEVSVALFAQACSNCGMSSAVDILSGDGVQSICRLGAATGLGMTARDGCRFSVKKRTSIMLHIALEKSNGRNSYQITLAGDLNFEKANPGAPPPKTRVLVIEMKDGSTQRIDLDRVQTMRFE